MEKMMMPACYNALSAEEMTYTEGGATALQALCAVLLPGYGTYQLVYDARAKRRANSEGWLTALVNERTADAGKGTANLVYQVASAVYTGLSCLSVIGAVTMLAIIYDV